MDEKEKKDIFARALEECNGIICDNIKLGKVMISQGYDKVLYQMIAVSYDYRHNDTTYENFISPRDLILGIDISKPIEYPHIISLLQYDVSYGYLKKSLTVAKLSNGHLIPTYSITVEDR